MDNPILSIYITTFNHSKYISQALDSVLSQKTDYPFEVLVGDDCSTDGTQKILQSYEKKYPGFFQIFYREHNMNKEYPNNVQDLIRRCKGKYLILLEGDDYWTDDLKIDRQIMFLEDHPDYLAVAHNCRIVDENSDPSERSYPECKHEEYTMEDYVYGILPGQTTTLMYINYWNRPDINLSFVNKRIQPGDKKKVFTLISHGKIHCIQKVMSAYRYVTNSGSSYSANTRYDFGRDKKWLVFQLEYAYDIQKMKAIECAEIQYLVFLRYALIKGKVDLVTGIRSIKEIKNIPRAFWWLMKRDLNKLRGGNDLRLH